MDWLFGGFTTACCSIQQCKSAELAIPVAGLSDDVSPIPSADYGTRVSRHEPRFDSAANSQRGLAPKPVGSERSVGTHTPVAAKPMSERALDGAVTPSTCAGSARDDGAATPSSRAWSNRSPEASSVRSMSSHLIGDMVSARCVDEANVRSQLKAFVRGMVQGREMSTLSVDGELRMCTCSFDRKLRNFILTIGGETRSIPLSKIKEILEGIEPQDIPTPLDDLCATLVLDSGECISFRLKSIQERVDVCFCLQIIVDKHEDKRT